MIHGGDRLSDTWRRHTEEDRWRRQIESDTWRRQKDEGRQIVDGSVSTAQANVCTCTCMLVVVTEAEFLFGIPTGSA